MSVIPTPERLPTPRAGEAVAVSRRHVLVLAVLVCIPVPLLSFGVTVLPLHGLVERAVATFAPFVAPVLGEDDGRVVRQRAVAVRELEVRLLPSETTGTPSRTDSGVASSLPAPEIPRTRAAKTAVGTKPKQRPTTGDNEGGSTASGPGVPLPTDDDPQTGGSSGDGSGGSGGSGPGGSGGGSGGSGGSGSGGSGGSGSGGSGGGSGGSGGNGSGSADEHSAPATPPAPPDAGGGSDSGGGSGASGGNGSGSADEHGPPATPPTPPDAGGGGGSGGSPPEKKQK